MAQKEGVNGKDNIYMILNVNLTFTGKIYTLINLNIRIKNVLNKSFLKSSKRMSTFVINAGKR